jgi:branched-chain amino acid transport system permease protein
VSLPAGTPSAPEAVLAQQPAPAGRRRLAVRSPAARAVLPALFCAAVLAAPLGLSGYPLREATTYLMYMGLALAWNLIGGLCGYPSFGQVTFFGMGAYVTAGLLVNLKLPLITIFAVSGLTAMAFVAVIGPIVLRLTGHYFAIATLGISQALGQIVIGIDWVGGPNGIIVRMPFVPSPSFFYYLMAAVFGLALLCTFLIMRGSWGYACRMIRQDEVAAVSCGVNATFYKTACWAVSACLVALLGAVYALWITFLNPPSVFDPIFSLTSVVLALVGGAGTLWGPVVGALLVEIMDQYLWAHLLTLHTLFLGLVVIVIVLFLPRGIWPYLSGEEALSWRSLFQGMERFRV